MTRQLRRSDLWQLWCCGAGLAFVVTTGVLAQSQDYINATLVEQIKGLDFRLGRLEMYMTAAIVATVTNLIAHVISIRTQAERRRRVED